MDTLKTEIKDLLDKLSRGEASPDEEKTIRIYLHLHKEEPELEDFRKLLKAKQEKKELKTSPHRYRKNSFLNIITLKIASFILFFGILIYALCCHRSNNQTETNEDFALLKGVKIEEKKQIEEYVKKKIKKVQLSISDCLYPLENIKKIKLGFEKEQDALFLIQNSFNSTNKDSTTKQEENEKDNKPNTTADTTQQQSTEPDAKITIQQIQQ